MSHAVLQSIVTKKYDLKGTVVVSRVLLSKPFSPAMNHSLAAATGTTDSAVINVDWLRTRVSFTHAITEYVCICANSLTYASSLISFSLSLFLNFSVSFLSLSLCTFFLVHGSASETEASVRLFVPACALVCGTLRDFVWLKKSLAGFLCELGGALSLDQWQDGDERKKQRHQRKSLFSREELQAHIMYFNTFIL